MSSYRDDSVFRGTVILGAVLGISHLLIAVVAPRRIVGLLTKVSVLPFAPFVAMFAGLTFVFPGSLIMLHELFDNGDPTFAIAYGAAAIYMAVAWWAFMIAEDRNSW